MVCVGVGWGWRGLVGVSVWCVCGLVLGGGRGGTVWGRHCWWWGGMGWVLCWMAVWVSRRVVWVLRVRTVRSLWSLAGCGAEVRVGGGCLGIRVGLCSVSSEWLLVDGARRHAVWVGGLLVVVGCSLYALVLLVHVCGPPWAHGAVRWPVCLEPV